MPVKKEYTEILSEITVDKEKGLEYWEEEYSCLQRNLSVLKEPALSNRIAKLELKLEKVQNRIKELEK